MKGVIIGAQYISIYSIPMIVIIAVVLHKKDLLSLGTGTISCEFWYAMLIIVACISLTLRHISMDGKAIQNAEKRIYCP